MVCNLEVADVIGDVAFVCSDGCLMGYASHEKKESGLEMRIEPRLFRERF